MKIAVVIPKYGLVGGAEGFSYELTERLAMRKRFEMHLFANQFRRGTAPIIFHKVPILPFPRSLRQISFAYWAERRIRRGGFDLIHSHDRIFRMHLLTMHGIPHKTWIRKVRNKRMTLFDRAMAWVEQRGVTGPNLRMVLPVSGLVAEELLRMYPIPSSRMAVIHPGISQERFASLDRTACRRQIRNRHGLSESDVVVLFVGMNFEIKQLGLVIEGIAHLVQKEKGASGLRLLVAGKGNPAPYQALAQRLGIGDRIIFAGVTREVETHYLASDIFVMPSLFDAFGMAVLEAMAAGLPVIITRNVGARDLVTDGVQGFVLGEPPEPADLGRKIAVLLDPEQRIKMGDQARSMALRHTWDRVADQVEAVYLMQRGLDFAGED
ncbi:MAG: glycosyltransferase family 4 protein [Deltaproteobacteria bacterium]|nr:glycosyltransferase family 4 protein [Deltaproteobacteria bacterium]